MKHVLLWLHVLPIIVGTASIVLTYVIYRLLNLRWVLLYAYVMISTLLYSLAYSFFYFFSRYIFELTPGVIIVYRITITCVAALLLITVLHCLTAWIKFNNTKKFKRIVYLMVGFYVLFSLVVYALQNKALIITALSMYPIIFLFLFGVLFKYRKELYTDKFIKPYVIVSFSFVYALPVNTILALITKFSMTMNLNIPFISVHCLFIFSMVTGLSIKMIRMIISDIEHSDSTKLSTFIEIYSITQREQQVLGNLLNGMNHKAISERLQISIRTVDKHVSNIYKKCNTKSLMELIQLIKKKGHSNPIK